MYIHVMTRNKRYVSKGGIRIDEKVRKTEVKKKEQWTGFTKKSYQGGKLDKAIPHLLGLDHKLYWVEGRVERVLPTASLQSCGSGQ